MQLDAIRNFLKTNPVILNIFTYGVFFFSTLMNLYTSLINVDVYHEGDKFPSSVAMSQNGMIFRDVNNIYGFLSSLIPTPFLEIFGPKLIVARVVGFAIKILLVMLFVLLLRQHIPTRAAFLGGAIWLAISPAWTNLNDAYFSNGFAWPTHYGMLFILISIFLFPKIEHPVANINYRLFFSSFLLAVSWSARLEFLATWLACFLFLVFLRSKREISNINLTFWILGGVSYFSIAFGWLFLNGAISDWYKQTIAAWYSNPPAQPKFTIIWFGMNLFSYLMVASLIIIVTFIIKKVGIRNPISYILSLILILLFCKAGPLVRDWNFHGYHIGAWLFEVSNRGLLSYVNVVFLVGVLLSLRIIFLRFQVKFADLNVPSHIVLISVVNISLLPLLHIVNADYIQMMIFPYALILVWFALKYDSSFKTKVQRILQPSIISLLVFMIVAMSSFSVAAAKPLYPYATTQLKGMYDQNPQERAQIDDRMNSVAKYSDKGIWSFCISGLPTIAKGYYAGKDQWLWNLEPEAWMIPRWGKVKSGDYLYVCSLSVGEQKIFDRNLGLGFLKTVHTGEGFSIFEAQGDLSQ